MSAPELEGQDLSKPETWEALSCLTYRSTPSGRESNPWTPELARQVSVSVTRALATLYRENAQDLLDTVADILAPLGAYGVESLELPDGSTCKYVNLGDTYSTTLLRHRGEFSLGSWGDLLESCEREHEEETGEVRCAYCGEWSEGGPCHTDMGEPRNVEADRSAAR